MSKTIGYIITLTGLLLNYGDITLRKIILILLILGTFYLEEINKRGIYIVSIPVIMITTIIQSISYIKQYTPDIGWNITNIGTSFPGHYCEDIFTIIGCTILFIHYRQQYNKQE